MELISILEKVFEQYGLVGLLFAALIVIPGLTLLKNRGLERQIELKAQELVNEIARREHLRAERLDRRLQLVMRERDEAESTIATLSAELEACREAFTQTIR